MKAARISENNLFAVITKCSWALLAALTLAGIVFGSMRFAVGILAGGVLVLANYYWLQSIIKRTLALSPRKAGRFAQWRYFLRLCVLALVIYVLLARFGVDVIGLLLGLSVLVIVISALSVYMFVIKGD